MSMYEVTPEPECKPYYRLWLTRVEPSDTQIISPLHNNVTIAGGLHCYALEQFGIAILLLYK